MLLRLVRRSGFTKLHVRKSREPAPRLTRLNERFCRMCKPGHPALERCRTLIVEDDRCSREALAKLLRDSGHGVMSVSTVGEAISMLRWSPRCVLLDLMLPDGSGIGVLRQIRENKLPVKVALISALRARETHPELYELRPDASFRKPLDVAALTRWLEEATA